MKRTLGLVLIACSVLTGLQGCATKVHVSALDQNLKPNETVDGLPFRSRERYEIHLYRFNGLTYEEVDAKPRTASLANLDALYVMRVSGGALSDGTVAVKLRTDNTLESVKVESTSKGQDALKAAGQGASDVADAKTARQKAAAEKAKAAEGEITGGEDDRVAALEAKQAADLAVVELAELSSTATQVDRLTVEQKIVRLRVVANQKARRAGLQPPYPDAGG